MMLTSMTEGPVQGARNKTNLLMFFELLAKGKRAALDVSDIGEIVCVRSKNQSTGQEGNGTPGQPYTSAWTRIAQCEGGAVL